MAHAPNKLFTLSLYLVNPDGTEMAVFTNTAFKSKSARDAYMAKNKIHRRSLVNATRPGKYVLAEWSLVESSVEIDNITKA